MQRFLIGLVVVLPLAVEIERASAQFTPVFETVAVTEFLVRPIGTRDGRQWVELYNFGDQPVNLKGFQLSNEAQEICDIPEATIQPHDFVIVVLGNDYRRPWDERKKIFETEWLGGKSDPRVVAVRNHYYLHGTDTLVLKNARRAPIWVMGWRADDKPGQSTYLAISDFRVRHYGLKEKPAINRSGPDGSVLGYEGQDSKKEDVAWTSDVSKLEEIAGYLYQTKAAGGELEPSVGSPLKGSFPNPLK